MYVYDPAAGHGLKHDPFIAIIAPRPIGWISTQSADGKCNLAPYSFFNAFNYRPPIVGFASIGRKDTLRNALETSEFVWNLATRRLAGPMSVTSAPFPPGADEFAASGLTPEVSRSVVPPRVAESPVSFECRVSQVVQLRTSGGADLRTWIVFGEVVVVHIAESLIKDGVYDTVAGDPILRGGGTSEYFGISNDQKLEIARPVI